MNFLNDSIPRAQGACLPPQLCTKLGHSFPHLLPKLQRLTHASREDLFPIQDQAASQKTSGFLPASATRLGTTSISPITSFPTSDLSSLASDKASGFTRQSQTAGRLRGPSQPFLHKLRMWRGNKVSRYHRSNVGHRVLLLPFRLDNQKLCRLGRRGDPTESVLLLGFQVGVCTESLVSLLSKFP